MKKYIVRYTSEFVFDLNDSFDWGVANWGESAAIKWADQIEKRIALILSKSPNGCPIAPENDSVDDDDEVRHLIVGRYRVLFTIDKLEVIVTHLRGPYNFGSE